MGSGSSRPYSSNHAGHNPKGSIRKKRGGALVPFLRSFSCGASPSWRTESFVQGNPTQTTDILACRNRYEKANAIDLSDEACAPYGLCNSSRVKLGHVLCDGSSSGHASRSPLQNPECLCVSTTGKVLEFPSRCDNSCSAASNSSKLCLDQSSRNGPWGRAENEINPALRSRSTASFGDINGGVPVEIASTNVADSYHASQQVDSPVPLSCSPDISSLESDDFGDHEITVPDSFQSSSRTHAIENVTDAIRNSPNFDCGGSMLSLEAASGSSHSDNHRQSEVSAPVSSLTGISNEVPSENIEVLHVEALGLVTESSGESSSSSRGEASGREARRNNRRRLWDALIRATARRRTLSPTFVLASDDVDGSGSWNDSWGVFDWSSMADEGAFADEGGFVVGRSSEVEERRWRIRSQVWALQRLSSGVEGGTAYSSRHCASGRHPDGYCSCETLVVTEESGTRASISRIVMLAEALFEVLDEIHRQSVALSRSTSLSLVSLPAPEAVVDSFPLRMYKKTGKKEDALEEAAQCYICLLEYEDGDRVRMLPCHHEYHMSCVDKWLKEVHRVCPLCRGDVCIPIAANSIP